MKTAQRIIKYFAIALGIAIIVGIAWSIYNGVGFMSGIFSSNTVTDAPFETKEISGEVKNLEFDMDFAEFVVAKGDAFKVEYAGDDITIDKPDTTLKIVEKTKKAGFFGDNKASRIKITVPEKTVFETVAIRHAAGVIKVENLSAKVLNLSLDAGVTQIESLTALSSADIHQGAGLVEIKGGAIKNLTLDAGMGQFTLISALTGTSNLKAGMGDMEIKLLGEKSSYMINAEKGIGVIKIDGNEYKDNTSFGTGENRVNLQGGIGTIKVEF